MTVIESRPRQPSITKQTSFLKSCHPEQSEGPASLPQPSPSHQTGCPRYATVSSSFTWVRSATRTCLIAALAFVTAFGLPLVRAQQPADHDPILDAMQQELTREQQLLLLPGMQRPYFIEYRIDDFASYEAVANYGALTNEQGGHQRVVRVTVRIGSYTFDSSSAKGDGIVQLAPTDNNTQAIRYALWLATDDAYKIALRNFAAKQATLNRFEAQAREHDFAQAEPVTHTEPLRSIQIDREDWKRRLIEVSGLYATAPEVRAFAKDVQYSTANLRAIAVNRYLVNTENTQVRTGYTGYQANISVGGQAADGMRLGRDNGTVAITASELESAAAFRQRTLDDLKSFNDLRNAPIVSADDYHGPILFSADAAADVLTHLFIPNVEADRPEPGTTARTQGAYNSSLHARVLPEFLNVTDDPLQSTFEGKHLLGAYKVDDEGVAAQPTEVVSAGKLENYLIGREPVRDFPKSNGHGRAAPAQAPRAHAGVTLFKPVPGPNSGTGGKLLSDADMTDHLLALAREQKRDVYAVETLGGELAPRVLFRVHPDGSRELVRGAVFDEVDTRSLRSSVIAAGGTPWIANALGPIPQTTIAPSLLFDDVVIKRAAEEQQKLPFYAPPPAEGPGTR